MVISGWPLCCAAGLDDLLGGLSVGSTAPAAAAVAAAPAAAAAADPFDLLGSSLAGAPAAAPAAAPADLPVLLSGDKGKGLTVRGKLKRVGGKTVYSLHLSNGSAGPVDGFMLQVNSNSAGTAPADQVVAVGTLAAGGSGSAQVVMAHNPAKLLQGPFSPRLQVWTRLEQSSVSAVCSASSTSVLSAASCRDSTPSFLPCRIL